MASGIAVSGMPGIGGHKTELDCLGGNCACVLSSSNTKKEEKKIKMKKKVSATFTSSRQIQSSPPNFSLAPLDFKQVEYKGYSSLIFKNHHHPLNS